LKQLKIKHLQKGLKTSKFPVIPDFIEFRASFGTVRVTQFRQKFFFGLKDRNSYNSNSGDYYKNYELNEFYEFLSYDLKNYKRITQIK